jgi:hypothetical protein
MEYSGKQCLHADFIIYDMIQPLERLLKVASNARSLSSRVCVCVCHSIGGVLACCGVLGLV